MALCDHEEADTRLLIHLKDALLNDCTNCLVRTIDIDVQVILLGKFHCLMTLCQDISVWVAFGAGKNFAYYHINAVYNDLGSDKSLTLLCFTASQDVTPHLHSLEKERRQHGRLGTALKM